MQIELEADIQHINMAISVLIEELNILKADNFLKPNDIVVRHILTVEKRIIVLRIEQNRMKYVLDRMCNCNYYYN